MLVGGGCVVWIVIWWFTINNVGRKASFVGLGGLVWLLVT